MKTPSLRRSLRSRRGGAAVELALLLPFLCFMFIASVDFSRLFYYGVTLENSARNGAYYASDYPNSSYVYNDIYGYTSLNDAVTRDASNLNSANNSSYNSSAGITSAGSNLTYSVYYSTSSSGPYNLTTAPSSGGYAQVTVNWPFTTITSYPGIDSIWNLSRVCRMRMAPAMPTFP